MTIKFHCPSCDKFLKTAEDKIGKRADCPGCGEPITVPEISDEQYREAEEDFGGDGLGGDVDYDEAYAGPAAPPETKVCPMCGTEIKAAAVKCRYCGEEFGRQPSQTGTIVPTVIEVGEVMGTTWGIFKSQVGACVGVVVVVGVLNFGFQQTVGLLQGVAMGGFVAEQDVVPIMLITLFCMVLTVSFQTWLTLGQTIYFLDLARGKPVAMSQIFSGGRFLGVAILATILYVLIVGSGMLLLLIPGIIFALMFGQHQILIVDQNLGVMDSLQRSREITSGNKGSLFVLGIAAAGVMILGMLAFCVGGIFSAGYITLMMVVAYLRMSGQHVAE